MEALMTLDCSNYSENIAEVLKIFQQIGWYIYNPQDVFDNPKYYNQETEQKPYSVFEVVEPINVKLGGIAPWFDEPVGGIQYLLPDTVDELYSIMVGGLSNEKLCLVKEDTWQVYYNEHGNKSGLKVFETESEACAFSCEECKDTLRNNGQNHRDHFKFCVNIKN